ncbi:MAG: hypothetical protein Q8R59_04105 [Polaromonas sp.]|nr:hypothetical protein [Polaromonas sp.]
MNWFNKLPDSQRSPYGLECRVLRKIPGLLLAAIALPALSSLLARLWAGEPGEVLAPQMQVFDFVMLGLAGTSLMLIATVTMLCVIIWVMKGPAYVADAYHLPGTQPARVPDANSELP